MILPSSLRALAVALVACISALVLSAPAPVAQTLPMAEAEAAPAPGIEAASPEEVRDLVSRLSDTEVRALLLARLDAVAAARTEAAAAEPGGLVRFVETATAGAAGSIMEAFERLPLLVSTQAEAFAGFYGMLGGLGLLVILTAMGSGILAGLLAERLVDRVTRAPLDRAAASAMTLGTLGGRMRFLGYRLGQDLVGVLVFFLVAERVGTFVATTLFEPQPAFRSLGAFAQIIWVYLIVIPRIGAAVSRFILAPRRPEFRLVHADDATARYLHRNQIGLFVLVGAAIGITRFNALTGVPMEDARLGFWLGTAVHLYVGIIAWQARDGLAAMMRGPDADVTATEARVARAYPAFAVAVSAGMWWIVNIITAYGDFDLLREGAQYSTMALLLMAPALDTTIRGLVQHLVPPMRGEGALAEAAHLATKRSYIRIGRVVVFVAVIVAIARIWGIDPSGIAAAGVGAQVAARIFEALFIAAIGYLAWELVSLWINRKLAAERTAGEADPGSEDAGEGGGAGGSRLSTVLPLLLGVLKAAVMVMFGLIALGSLGIDIAPLLAGAGIIGLAIGFGAQKLVADIVSGIFFLVDDAFRVGEYVEVGGTRGTVEKISIRSMQLRHHLGPVHTLPYGEIPQITNYSRDWVIMKLKFTVPFETDPNKVKKIFKKIGAEMAEVPEFRNDMLQPFKSQGVFDFDDRGMIVRGKFMARPGKQFTLRKEIYNRVKRAFEEAAIPFARRAVQVEIHGADPDSLTEEQKARIAAAAGEAAMPAAEALAKG